MNDEIKEILNQLEIVGRKHTIEICEDGSKIETMPASVVNELRLNNYSAKILLDYITNLQKENEILKELNICVGCENNPDYKSRCEKTIEYIKSNYIDNPIEFKKELLSILGGDK